MDLADSPPKPTKATGSSQVTEADIAALQATLARQRVQPPADLLQKIEALIAQERAKEQGLYEPQIPRSHQRRTLMLFLLLLAVLLFWLI